MRLRILLGAVVLAALLGAANNLRLANPLPWLGSPAVLVQNPWDVIKEPRAVELRKTLKYTLREAQKAWLPIAVVLAAAVALRKRVGFEKWFRAGCAAMLLAACWYKLQSPPDFAEAVAQYQLLPKPLVNVFALWLPALELIVAIGLFVWPREMYALLAALWVMFIAALGWAIYKRLGITCGCFALRESYGSVAEAWFSLLRDVVLLGPTLWLAVRPRKACAEEGLQPALVR